MEEAAGKKKVLQQKKCSRFLVFSLAQKNKDNKENLENYSAAADVFFLLRRKNKRWGKGLIIKID